MLLRFHSLLGLVLQSSWHLALAPPFIFKSPDGLVCLSYSKPALTNLGCKEFSLHPIPTQGKANTVSPGPQPSKAPLLPS